MGSNIFLHLLPCLYCWEKRYIICRLIRRLFVFSVPKFILHTCCVFGSAILLLGSFNFFEYSLIIIVDGSKLLGTPKKSKSKDLDFFIQAAGLVYHPTQVGISSKAAFRLCISSRASVHYLCGLMIYNTTC